MDRPELEQKIEQLADGALSPAEETEVRALIDADPGLVAEYEGLLRVKRLVRAAAEGERAPDALHAAIGDMLRAASASDRDAAPPRPNEGGSWIFRVAAAAAVLVAGWFVAVYLGWFPVQPTYAHAEMLRGCLQDFGVDGVPCASAEESPDGVPTWSFHPKLVAAPNVRFCGSVEYVCPTSKNAGRRLDYLWTDSETGATHRISVYAFGAEQPHPVHDPLIEGLAAKGETHPCLCLGEEATSHSLLCAMLDDGLVGVVAELDNDRFVEHVKPAFVVE